MTVLVTGGTGFVGQHVVAALIAAGHDVVATSSRPDPTPIPGVRWIHADLLDAEAAGAVCRSAGATHLVHLAWRPVHSGVIEAADNIEWLEVGFRLARAFLESGGERIVGVGTCYEYDWGQGFCREHVTPLEPTTYYGSCKQSLHAAIAGMARHHGASLAWPRIFFTYGPGEHETRFVRSIVRALLMGQPAEMTHGRQIRDFVFVEDIADAIARLVGSSVSGPFNVSSGQPVTLRDIAASIAAQTGRADLLRIGARSAPAHEPVMIAGDPTLMSDAVGWSATTSLDDGIARTIAHERQALGSSDDEHTRRRHS